MIRFLLSRLLQGIIVILAVITITFALSRMLPGGPIQSEKNTSPEAIAAQRAYLGLDKPWYEQLGLQIAPLVAGLGVAGLGVGLALQGVLSNIVAGLSIIFTKPYRVGEHVSLLGVHGDVAKIDIFTTTLVHPDQSRIVIPNRKVVGEILHNFGTIRQLDLSIGVSYQTNIDTTLRRLRDLVTHHPKVLQTPAPIIGIAAFADSSITLSIRPWVEVATVGASHIELNQAILQQLQADGVEIPFPQREVRLLNPS